MGWDIQHMYTLITNNSFKMGRWGSGEYSAPLHYFYYQSFLNYISANVSFSSTLGKSRNTNNKEVGIYIHNLLRFLSSNNLDTQLLAL